MSYKTDAGKDLLIAIAKALYLDKIVDWLATELERIKQK